MPMPSSAFQQGSQPSCFDKMKYGEIIQKTHWFCLKNVYFVGFTIGFCVGMASGALFGGFSALRWAKMTTGLCWEISSKLRNSDVKMLIFLGMVWEDVSW